MSIQYHIKPFVELKPIEICVILRAFLTSFLILFLSISVFANPDTTIQNVEIHFTIADQNIPKNWVNCIEAGQCKLVSLSEHRKEQVLKTIQVFLHDYYSLFFLTQQLKRIYVLDTLLDRGILIGGKANYEFQYILSMYRDSTPEYNHRKLLNTLHHEFSHNLRNKNWDQFPHKDWKKFNLKKYGKGGHHAIKKGSSSQLFDTLLCKVGFLHEYGSSSADEDFASFAENLFLNRQEFWKLVDQYPLIKAKKDLTIQFYHSLDPKFTEEYFKNLPVIS